MSDVVRRPAPAPRTLAALCGLLYLPFVGPGFGNGYGTDIDITNILRSGESIYDGSYRYSRAPGAFPHELVTGTLDRLGGAPLVNLGSVAMAVLALVALAHLVERHHGDRAARIAVIVVATQPWFWVAATSLGDYVYALAFVLLGVDAAQRDRRVLAGLAFGTAIGFRAGSVLLVGAYLLAEVTGGAIDDDPDEDPDDTFLRRWSKVVLSGGLAFVVGVAWFVPPWLSVGRTTRFLDNQLEAGDLWVMAARWGVKNIAFFGLVTLVVLVVRAPVLLEPLSRFRSQVLVRFAVFGALATEALFLRFPWKPVHLLPTIVGVALLLAVGARTSNRFVGLVVASQLCLAVVSFTVAAPDVRDAATSGEFRPGITRGVVANELDCRTDLTYEGGWPDLDTPAADFAAVEVFVCQARSWRAGEGPTELP